MRSKKHPPGHAMRQLPIQAENEQTYEPATDWSLSYAMARQHAGWAVDDIRNHNYIEALYNYHIVLQLIIEALVYTYTGKIPSADSVHILLHECDAFCSLRTTFFPGDTPEEMELLAALEQAYKTDGLHTAIPVNATMAATLGIRVNKIMTLATELYKTKVGAAPAANTK